MGSASDSEALAPVGPGEPEMARWATIGRPAVGLHRLWRAPDTPRRVMAHALACREGGVLSVVGVYGVIDKFPMGVIMNKGLTVRTAQQHGQAYMPRLLAHAAKGELDPSFLATHRMTLEEGPAGYRMFKAKEDGCVRAVFAPG